MTNQIEDKNACLIVNNKEHEHDGMLLQPKGDLCGFCEREKSERDLTIAGHTVSICSGCFASLNRSGHERSVCGRS
jgi:deoxyxylulose-5-phosphate synthase